MKKLSITVALFFICTTNVGANQIVTPDVQTTVTVSNRDVNRFVCPGTMQDMIYSKEKALTGHFSKSDAFVKFKIKQVGKNKEYATADHELFLVCDGNVYTIIAKPSNMPSTTVRLTPPKGDSFKKNVAMFKNMPLEKQALHIIRQAYDEQYPSSYKITTTLEQVNLKPELDVLLKQYIDVEGVGLRLKRYDLTSRAPGKVNLTETDFLRSDISPSLLAVAIEDHTLRPNDTTRLFVVEKREGN